MTHPNICGVGSPGHLLLPLTRAPDGACGADEEEGENEDGAPARLQYDRALMPELVVSLEAPDTFLRERVSPPATK